MSDSDEESVVSVRHYGHGRDIFRKHDPDESVQKNEEEGETEETDEDENEEDEEDDEETDDDEE